MAHAILLAINFSTLAINKSQPTQFSQPLIL